MLELTEIEHHATAVRVAQIINIPGLLQTTDHARALFSQTVHRSSPTRSNTAFHTRIKRQEVLHRDAPRATRRSSMRPPCA